VNYLALHITVVIDIVVSSLGTLATITISLANPTRWIYCIANLALIAWLVLAINFNRITPMPMVACATFIKSFVLQRLIARNDRELFSSNRGVSHLNEACRIDELSRGFVLGLKFSQTTSTSNQNVP
jgi:hypothetical protein